MSNNKNYILEQLDKHKLEQLARKTLTVMRDMIGGKDKIVEAAGDDNPDVARLKQQISQHKDSMKNKKDANDSYHTSGDYEKDSAYGFRLQQQLKDLQGQEKQQADIKKEEKQITEAKRSKKKKAKKKYAVLFGPKWQKSKGKRKH